jgi:hypothetical protein
MTLLGTITYCFAYIAFLFLAVEEPTIWHLGLGILICLAAYAIDYTLEKLR